MVKKPIRGSWKYDRETGKLVSVWEEEKDTNAPFVQQDTIEPTMSMTGTDKVYESKSALRREYKELGFEEVGEKPKPENCAPKKYKSDFAAIRETALKEAQKLKWGMAPLSEKERHERLCGSEEQRRYDAWKTRNWLK